MTLIPHRTVASQVAAQLREDIAKGRWQDWLPGERTLCETTQASRNTVRAALAQLKAERLIKPVRGKGNRVIGASAADNCVQRVKTVGVLIPVPIGQIRPVMALWIDELRSLLIEDGYRLRVHSGPQYYRANSTATLEKLVRQDVHHAWILTLSSEVMQRWFVARGVNCVVAGSVYGGLSLPSVDIDYRAIGRHSAGVCLRAGHRRVALLSHGSRRAGEIENELGFMDAMEQSAGGCANAEVAYHDDSTESVTRAFRQLFAGGKFPTAIVVGNSYAYLTVAGLLAQRQLRVPQDVSLISRDDDPFMRAVSPEPARYITSPQLFAKRLLGLVLRLADQNLVKNPCIRLMPKFVAGESISRLPR